MFPAYGRGGGGRGGGGHHHQNQYQQNRGHNNRGHGGGQSWDAPDGASGSGGFMIDRGGSGPSSSSNYGGGGGSRGGGDRRGGGGRACYKCNEEGHFARECPNGDASGGGGGRGGRSYNQSDRNRGNDRRGGRGGGHQEVVDLDASDDDNVVHDAASGSRNYDDSNSGGRKRHRSGSSSSHSHSHQHKKKNRSRSPESRHRHRDRDDRHGHSDHRNRSQGHRDGGGNNGRDGGGQRRSDSWGNQDQQRDRGGGGGYQDRGWNSNAPVPAPVPLMPVPWIMDINPNVLPLPLITNPFDQFQMQHQQTGNFGGMAGGYNDHDNRGDRRGNFRPEHDSRDRGDRVRRDGGRSGRASRWDDGFQAQEQRRLQVSSGYPQKVFLDEVHLDPEFAFRVDTNSNPGLVKYRSIAMNQKSAYDGGVGKGVFGASEDELKQVYSKFSSFRCKLPDAVDVNDDSQQQSDEDDDDNEISKPDSLAKNYISIGNTEAKKAAHNARLGFKDRVDTSRDFDSCSLERKDGEMNVQEKTEYYNKEVRKQPHNIPLWKEFVKFQDKVFEESSMIFEEEIGYGFGQSLGGQKPKKKKSNRKALLEKKIAILEKALESNPNSLQLHLQRLECLLDLYKPRHVLTEWKKLVLQHQQSAPFWIEYLMFSASQLLIYSNSSTISTFDTGFQKFRLMMNPQYPDFQRPTKFLMFLSDVTFGLSLLLKNAGFLERAIALHQAQLEFDFHCPKELLNGDTVQNWKEISEAFEKFWSTGTPRFGENGYQGWQHYIENEPEDRQSIVVSDASISQFEEDTFETFNERFKSEAEGSDDDQKLISIKQEHKPSIWTSIESCRSKLYWLPWRELCSDVDDCEDAQRVIPSSAILNFLCPLPNEANFISKFDRPAAHFRHLVSFLMTLREDFIPHTQSIDFVCSPFLSTTLTESSSLFTEIYYWKKIIDIYVEANTPENASKFHHVFAPEGFKIQDLISPNWITTTTLKPTLFNVSLRAESQLDDENPPPPGESDNNADTDEKRLSILKENNSKYMDMFYRVLAFGLENLDPEFACTLFEMLLRFEQKLTCTEPGNIKQRMKYAKGLMKNDTLRNASGGYRELAMLEYFGGNLEKAVALLVKTIDATRKTLNSEDWEEMNWDQDWKLLVDLISLYRQLVELYLRNGTTEDDSKGYYTLLQLGNCFKPLDSNFLDKGKDEDGEDQMWTPKTNVLLKASRSYEKIMTMLIPNFKKESEEDVANDELVEKDVYCKWGGENCVEFLLQQRNLIVEWTCCYALFQYLGKDFDEACLVYENVLKRLDSEQFKTRENYNPELIRIHIREQLYINWCNLAARCLAKDPLMNSKFRSILSRALEEFPSSPPLLILFTDVENQTSVAGKLWRLMMNNMKPDSDKPVTHWTPLIMGIGLARKIEELEHDEEVGLPCFGLGGPAVPQDTIFYKLDSMIAVAEQHPGVRHCPLLWRVHLKMLALRSREGKDVERAKKIFYDAVRHCPSSKAIYLDGVAYFPELLQEVNELMAEKQLLVRLPLEELDVLLEMDEEGGNAEKEEEQEGEMDEENGEDEYDNGKREISAQGRKARESKSEGEIGDSD